MAVGVAVLLDGQVAVVTGSGRGIGRAIARGFAQHGARVVVNDRDAGPTEVATCVLFLASPLSPYVTGQVFAVDGGLIAQARTPDADVS